MPVYRQPDAGFDLLGRPRSRRQYGQAPPQNAQPSPQQYPPPNQPGDYGSNPGGEPRYDSPQSRHDVSNMSDAEIDRILAAHGVPEGMRAEYREKYRSYYGVSADQAAEEAKAASGRTNQVGPTGSSTWHRNPDGTWSNTLVASPELQGIYNSMVGQAGDAWDTPLDNGAQARQHAEDAIYQRATSRLDPMWNQREQSYSTQLANQGLDLNSEAFKNAMGDFGRQRNDAYSSALMDAIIGGGQEASRQQGMDLRSRFAPLQGMTDWNEILNGGLPRASGPSTDYPGGLERQRGEARRRQQEDDQRLMDLINGGSQIARVIPALF